MKLHRSIRRGCGLMGAYLIVAIIANGLWLLSNIRRPHPQEYYPASAGIEFAQCANGSCGVPTQGSVGSVGEFAWRFDGTSGPWQLVRFGQVVGTLGVDGSYRDNAGKEAPCPTEWRLDGQKEAIAKHTGKVGEKHDTGEITNFGLDVSKLGNAPQARLRNQPISREQAFKLIEEGIPDANRRRLVIIGSPAERKLVTDQLQGDLASSLADCIIQEYAPSDWQVKDAGFVTTGHPTVYGLEPDGKTIFRQDDASGLRFNIEALRKPGNYDSASDKDWRNGGDSTTNVVFFLIVGVAAFILLQPTKAGE